MLMAELSFFICFPLSIGMEVWESRRGRRRNLWKLNQTSSMRCMCVRVGVCEYVCVCKKQISWPALCRVYNCNQAGQTAALHTHWPQMDRASCRDPMTATVSPLLPPTVHICLITLQWGLFLPPRPPVFHFFSPQACLSGRARLLPLPDPC